MIMILNVVSLSSTWYCVNLYINCFMSAGTLLFIDMLSILYMIMVLHLVLLSSTCYSVNMWVHLCSVCKLLFTASYSMLASFPGSHVGEEEREPGTHCLQKPKVPLVTCIILCYTKITVNFCLPSERPLLPMRLIKAVVKSKTISL